MKREAEERVNRRAGLAMFLQNRRARLQPGDVGLPRSQRRRTPGLRREELAQLVGVGVSWYTWLEQGRDIQVSDQLLARLASILRLNQSERQHLFQLARETAEQPEIETEQRMADLQAAQAVLKGLQYPARIFNHRLSIVACNPAATQVFGDRPSQSGRESNMIWVLFTSPAAKLLNTNWQREAQRCLASLRTNYDRYPNDPWLTELIHDLQRLSPEFRAWWSEHPIRLGCANEYEINHPQVGRMVLHPTVLALPTLPDMQLVVYVPLQRDASEAKFARLMAQK